MTNDNRITLEWSAVKSIKDLQQIDQNIAGVYIWGFMINYVFIPYYVGVAYNIVNRIYGHINSLVGGRYRVFHRNSLANFTKYKNQGIKPDKSEGEIYIPNWPHGYKDFLSNRKELGPHIDYMIDTFTFTYATIDRQIFSNEDFKEIVIMCINQIGKENLINERSGRFENIKIEHIGNTNIYIKFNKTNQQRI